MESNLTNTQGTGTPDRRGGTLEIYNTIILAIATLSVAWCSYQSSLWNGIQTFKLADSNKFNRLAQQQTLQIGQNRQIDAAIVSDFLQAVLDKKQKTIEFILRGVRPELSTAMRHWLDKYYMSDSTAPPHPMVMPEYKELVKRDNAEPDRLHVLGDQSYKEADRANSITDKYSLLTVLFSMAMFLSAIATKAARQGTHFALVLIAAVICVADLVVLIVYMPIASK